MLTFFTIVHVLLCIFMVFVILLQPGKDAGMGAALGGGAATSAFGGRGAVTFLSKVTAICAGLFFLTSLGLSFVGLRGSVVDLEQPVKEAPAKSETPAAPVVPAGQGAEQPAGASAPAVPVQVTPAPAEPAAAPAPEPAPVAPQE